MTSRLKVPGLIPAIAYWCFIKSRASTMCKIDLCTLLTKVLLRKFCNWHFVMKKNLKFGLSLHQLGFINFQSFEIATLCAIQICILCIALIEITSRMTYIKWLWLYIKLKIKYLVTCFLYRQWQLTHIDCVCGRTFCTLLSQRSGFKDDNQNTKISKNPRMLWF